MEHIPWWIAGLYAAWRAANETLRIILDYKTKMKELDSPPEEECPPGAYSN